jgi:hypothetical protein
MHGIDELERAPPGSGNALVRAPDLVHDYAYGRACRGGAYPARSSFRMPSARNTKAASTRTSAATRLLAWMPARRRRRASTGSVTGLADRQRQGRGARFPALAAAVVVREHAAAPDNQRLRGCDSDDACFALVKEASGAPGRLQSSLAPGEPPRGTAAFTGSSSAPVHRPQTSAPLSCMDRRSQPVAAACAPIQERQKLPIVRRRRLDLVQLGCLGIPLSKCCSLPESESMSSRGDLYMRCR